MALVVLSITISTTSCKKADIKFGEDFLNNDITQLFKTDSFSVDLSTIYIDSFITSARGTVLGGAYTDPLFGRVSTQSFFQIIPPLFFNEFDNTSFDSITIVLSPIFSSYYGDSTMPVNVTVHELLDSIQIPEGQFYFYNTSSFKVKPGALVSKNVKIRPNAFDKVEIRLPDALGLDFLNRLKSPTDITMKSAAAFLSYFKGLRISSDNSSEMIVGFGDDVKVRIHYKKQDLITQNRYADFTIANKAYQFNNISINRTGAIQNLGPSNKVIHSSLTNNTAYLQSSTGAGIKLTFPTLKNILKVPNFAKVLKAVLLITPIKGSYSTTYYLPPVLRLSSTNINNNIGNDLAYVNTNGSLAIQLGLLQTDYFLGENTKYQYDLTEYVKEALRNTNIIPGDGLLLSPPSPNFESLFSRVAIGNKYNSLGKIELQIFYAAVK